MGNREHRRTERCTESRDAGEVRAGAIRITMSERFDMFGCLYDGGGVEARAGDAQGFDVYMPVAPGGEVSVGDGGHLHLGPGAVIRALDGGGFVITVPRQEHETAGPFEHRGIGAATTETAHRP